MAEMDRDLQTVLLRDNPWIPDPGQLAGWLRHRLPPVFHPRSGVEPGRRRWQEADRAHLVIGPRQAGKSTLIWAHLAELGTPALFVDCELPLVQAWCRSAALFLDDLDRLVAEPVTLFFEEVQHLEDAGLFLKGLVDRRIGVPILVTGSSSYHLGARTRESLAGRATRTRLLPFSLAEVSADLDGKPEILRQRLITERLDRHCRFGGYPEVWLSETPEVHLADLVEAFVLRDASDLFRIQRPDAFRRLLRLLAGQAGSLVNLSEWAALLGLSRDTVASYLEILESSHVVAILAPFAGGRRSELTRNPKAYLLDSGIRNQLLHDFRPLEERPDSGPALESWVMTELWKTIPGDATLHFWRSTSGAEVDFVAAVGEVTVGVEVKAGALRRPVLARGVRSFIDAYRPSGLFVVNTGFEHTQQVGETEVKWILPMDLAAEVAGILGEARSLTPQRPFGESTV